MCQFRSKIVNSVVKEKGLSFKNMAAGNGQAEQAGTGPSRRYIQGSKIAKTLPSVKYSLLQYSKRKFYEKKFSKKLLTKKMDRVAHRGLLARASGALKGGHSRNCQQFCRSWRGTLWRKNKFSNKSLTMPKNWKGDPLGFFNIHSVAKHQKIEGGPFWEKNFRKKVSQCRKKIGRGDPLVSPGMVCYAGKQETFLVQFARPNSAIWCNNIL